jgi:hypothetical protein
MGDVHGAAAFIAFFTDGQAVAAGEVAAIGKPAKAPLRCIRGPGVIFEG